MKRISFARRKFLRQKKEDTMGLLSILGVVLIVLVVVTIL